MTSGVLAGLVSQAMRVNFVKRRPLILNLDASQYGICAIFMQKHIDTIEHIFVTCALRTLSTTKRCYKQIKKGVEYAVWFSALFLTWGVNLFCTPTTSC